MRTIAVTGSASGLGAAVVRRMRYTRHRVIGIDRRDADIEADLATARGRATAVEGVLDRCGGKLEGLVPCAGIGPHVKNSGKIAAINYFGAVAMLDGLKAALGAGVAPAAVAISSNSATTVPIGDHAFIDACLAGEEEYAVELAARHDGATIYGNSKLALAQAVRERAKVWGAAGVRLNAVAPGPFDSALLQAGLDDPDMGPLIEAYPIPLERRGTADEVADAIEFLLSAHATWIHGSILFVDGGTDALLNPTRL
ncbi:MAG TPA: SDR family oxidoreductase [Acidimicrobiia bacterium]|nr:SDR family oxidoreductase [Acidimicrobiia bacterium]